MLIDRREMIDNRWQIHKLKTIDRWMDEREKERERIEKVS